MLFVFIFIYEIVNKIVRVWYEFFYQYKKIQIVEFQVNQLIYIDIRLVIDEVYYIIYKRDEVRQLKFNSIINVLMVIGYVLFCRCEDY